jgi:hypothetical protein
LEFIITGTKGYASALAEVIGSQGDLAGVTKKFPTLRLQGAFYDNERLTSLSEITDPTWEGINLRGLYLGFPATTLPSFINIGTAREREYGVDCYVGRLVGPNEVIFTIKEHPIVSEVAQRDEKMLAVYRAVPPFHMSAVCERLPFNYPMGVIEVEVSCTPAGRLSSAMALTPTYQKLAIFFLYTRP